MLFLMNDVVLDLAGQGAPPPPPAERLRVLSLDHVLKLGCELYAERPLLHREDPERARRLAALLVSKAPSINAALFVAPARGCSPQAVQSRVAELGIEVMAGLQSFAQGGALTAQIADREVWRRLAA